MGTTFLEGKCPLFFIGHHCLEFVDTKESFKKLLFSSQSEYLKKPTVVLSMFIQGKNVSPYVLTDSLLSATVQVLNIKANVGINTDIIKSIILGF